MACSVFCTLLVRRCDIRLTDSTIAYLDTIHLTVARTVLTMALIMEMVLTGALILLIMDLLTHRRLLTMVTLPSPSLEATRPLRCAPLAPAILTMETLPPLLLHPLLITEVSLITVGLSMAMVVSVLKIMRATPLHL
jgi:hypothetical protein